MDNRTITLAGRTYILVEPRHKDSRVWRKEFGSKLVEPILNALKSFDWGKVSLTSLDINVVLDRFAPVLIQVATSVLDLLDVNIEMFSVFSEDIKKDVDFLNENVRTSELLEVLTAVMQIAYPLESLPVIGLLLKKDTTSKS